jgi:hypothetical protein
MGMQTWISASLCLGLSIGFSNFAFAGAYQELNPEQQNAVQNGVQVFLTQDVPGQPWPKAYVYQRIDATPEEAAAVFTDFDLQHTYIPNLTKSSTRGWIGSGRAIVDYELHLPWPFDPDVYSTDDRLSTYDGGDSFKVDWTLITSTHIASSEGNARFERLGTGTLMAYYTFVVPDSSFASWVTDRAMDQVKSTVRAIGNQIEQERTQDQALLKKQTDQMRSRIKSVQR